MDGDAAGAAIGVLVQNLIHVIKEEISLTGGLTKSAENLKRTLGMIQNSLDDAQKKFITEKAVRGWLKELEDVAFDADNALDELNYHLVSNRMETTFRTKKAAACFPWFKRYVHRRHLALTIKEINTSFDTINSRATQLGLERRLADAADADADVAERETDSSAADPIFIGRDGVVLEIVEMLTCQAEKAVSILPIVGMGGMGKTTLVRKVFNHEKIKSNFGLSIWVHVSRNFDVVALLKKILTDLKGGNVEEDGSKQVVTKKLREALGGKTYLLVLDDVWNEDVRKWEDFINSWLGITSTKGNRILATTRKISVASIMKTRDVHILSDLSEEQCWFIIKNRVFEGGDIPNGIEAIGRLIAKRCQGLPLAANVIGGVLRDKSRDEWLSIKDNWLPGDANNISSILRLSYDNLSSASVKKCFSYCSIFPKGSRIRREELVELWMAEGFLQPSRTSDMENVGEKVVNLLAQSSLLQVVGRDEFNNVKHCNIHDLVHDLATSVLGFPDNTSDRYMLWQNQGDESNCIPKEQTKRLRTIMCIGKNFDFVYSDFKSLHALILNIPLQELPDSIKELIHLRLLDISFTHIETLPNSVCTLYQLQTFRAHKSLEELPCAFKYLLNLRHLHVHIQTILPPQLGMLTSLRTLPHFDVYDEEGHRIAELGSLKDLKGSLAINYLENVRDEVDSSKACLFEKSGVVRLELCWRGWGRGRANDKSVLKGLQPHPNLKILDLKEKVFRHGLQRWKGLIT